MEEIPRYVPAPAVPAGSPALPEAIDAAFFSRLRAPTRFYLVRHGQTVANARRVVQGLSDYPLDETGRGQAAALGSWLADQGIDRVLSSPLARAAETASIVSRQLSLPKPGLRDELREIDTGRFSGLSLEEAKARFPGDFAAFERLSWEGVPDAEREAEVHDRAARAWAALLAEAEGGSRRIVCVTHGGFIQWLVRVTFGSRSWMPLLPTGNCGVFELLVEPAAAQPQAPGEAPGHGFGHPGGAKLFWERINFLPPSGLAAVPPVF